MKSGSEKVGSVRRNRVDGGRAEFQMERLTFAVVPKKEARRIKSEKTRY